MLLLSNSLMDIDRYIYGGKLAKHEYEKYARRFSNLSEFAFNVAGQILFKSTVGYQFKNGEDMADCLIWAPRNDINDDRNIYAGLIFPNEFGEGNMSKAQKEANRLVSKLENMKPIYKGLILFMPYDANPRRIREKIMHEEENKKVLKLVDLGYTRKFLEEYF